MSYEVNGALKFYEEDVYAHGCTGNGSTTWIDIRWQAETLLELVAKLNSFVQNNNPENVLYDACDEDGRLDIQVYENEYGHTVGANEIAEWKEGKRRLWLCDYSFRVERVERKAISLAELV